MIRRVQQKKKTRSATTRKKIPKKDAQKKDTNHKNPLVMKIMVQTNQNTYRELNVKIIWVFVNRQ